MNQNRRTVESRSITSPASQRSALTFLLIGLVGLASLSGCGGEDSSQPAESSVVTPPRPQSQLTIPETESGDDAPAPGEAPGELVLPPGDIPPATEPVSEPGKGGIEMPKTSTPPGRSGAQSGLKIQYGSWQEIEQMVTSTGQITVVDLWSLSCEPCIKEFPGLVRLHQSLGDSVRCVAVDLDYDGRKTRPPEYYQQRVADFLQSVGAEFTTYISSTPSDEVYAATDLDSIPAVLIYDAQGKIVQVFVDAGETAGFTYDEDVIPLVTKLAG